MDKLKELNLMVEAEWLRGKVRGFKCGLIGEREIAKGVLWVGFTVRIVNDTLLPEMRFSVSLTDKDIPNIPFSTPEILPVSEHIHKYRLTSEEQEKLGSFFPSPSRIEPGANEYFGELLKGILEGAGYVVIIKVPDYYYPAPAQMGFVAPAFGIGLQRKVKPEKIIEEYGDTYVYLSHEKPKSKIQVQFNFLDNIPEERLEGIERSLKENLSPYGLKCLYLVLQGCAQNQRTNSFVFDTNRSLDSMGHERDKRGIHYTRNKKRVLRSLEELTRINFNFETRIPAKGKKDKEEVTRFIHPLISTTGKFETWEVKKGEPAEKGKLIRDGILIYFHPEIYKFIENRYTTIPHEYLKIDAGNRPHAILLYSYIANQWRIGWNQYKGTIKQPMRQILDGAGLLKGLPKRKNQQRDFVEKIKDDLRWLKSRGDFWIKTVRIETKNKPHLDHMVIIEMSDSHPFKISMTKQIEGE
jgi:hypothetical protein